MNFDELNRMRAEAEDIRVRSEMVAEQKRALEADGAYVKGVLQRIFNIMGRLANQVDALEKRMDRWEDGCS